MPGGPLSDIDRDVAETALALIQNKGREWYTSAAFEQVFGAVHMARIDRLIPGFPAVNLVAALELRASAVTIVQKVAWLHERKRSDALDDGRWMYFAASDIVAFHVLLRSLFDSIAVAITRIAPKRGVTAPSFAHLRADLAPGSKKEPRTRTHLGDELSAAVLSCYWFEDLRDVRDDIVHRGAQALAYPHEDQILFQVHMNFAKRVLVPAVMFNDNVVDWTRYSALVMARVMVFLNLFAEAVFALTPTLEAGRSDGTHSVHPGYAVLRDGISQLLGASASVQ
ncbi:MAG: hypothetical protein ABSB99_08355 [Acidimicrobiales bacterium]